MIDATMATGHVVANGEIHKVSKYDALRGFLIVLGGSGLIIGLAFAAVISLTGPDGWVTKAANSAVSTASGAMLASYTEELQ